MSVLTANATELVSEIEWEGSLYRFAEPWQVSVECEEAAWSHSYARLDISSYGETREESWENFRETVAVVYAEYALRDPVDFGTSALRLRRLLQDSISFEPRHG